MVFTRQLLVFVMNVRQVDVQYWSCYRLASSQLRNKKVKERKSKRKKTKLKNWRCNNDASVQMSTDIFPHFLVFCIHTEYIVVLFQFNSIQLNISEQLETSTRRSTIDSTPKMNFIFERQNVHVSCFIQCSLGTRCSSYLFLLVFVSFTSIFILCRFESESVQIDGCKTLRISYIIIELIK